MTTHISALTLAILAAVACSLRSGPANEVQNFRLLNHLSLTELGLQQPDDGHVWSVTGWSDAASHREFALISSTLSTTFVEVTDPAAPRLLGHASDARFAFAEAAVVNNRLYVPDLPGQRVAHYDLRQLLTVSGPPRTFQPTLLPGALAGLSGNVSNDRLYVARSGSLQAYDVSAAASPALVGELALSGFARTLATTYAGPDADYQGHPLVFGTRPASGGAKLAIVDFSSQPELIAESNRNPSPGLARGVALTADHSYALLPNALGTGLFVADIRNLDAPALLERIVGDDWLGTVDDVEIRGAYAYVSNNSSGLAVIDTRQATSGATLVDDLGRYDTSESTHSVYPHLPSGNVLVAQNGSLTILSPFRARGDGNWDGHVSGADYTIWSDNFGLFNGDAEPSDGDYNGDGFVTGADYTIWSDTFGRGSLDESSAAGAVPEPSSIAYGALVVGMLGIGARCRVVRGRGSVLALLVTAIFSGFMAEASAQSASGFRQLGALDPSQLGGIGEVTDVRGWVDPLDGREYAIVGGDYGSAFVDVSMPADPQFLGFLPNQENQQFNRRTLEVIDDHAFIGGLGLGGAAPLQVFDLTQLRGITTPQTFAPTFSGQPQGAFAFAASATSQTLYSARGNNRLEAYDVSNPTAPQLLGFAPAVGGVWDVLAVQYAGPDGRYAGCELALVAASGRLSIFDFSDRTAPQFVSDVVVPGANVALFQVELSPDQRYALATREDDESTLSVFDLSDLTQPQWLGQVGDADWGSPQLFLQNRGHYAYVTGPLTGLRVFDAESALPNNESFQDMGFFDPEDYAYQFDVGLPSGSILLANAEDGLTILSPFRAPGDGNWDGHIDGADFTIWADNFGQFNGAAQFADGDYNGDGFVTGADYTLWSDYFGRGSLDDAPPAMANIPEPGSLALLGAGAVALTLGALTHRRRARPRATRPGHALPW